MLFDVQAALSDILNSPPAPCDSRDFRDSTGAKSQQSQPQEGGRKSPTGLSETQSAPVATPATPATNFQKSAPVSRMSRVSQPQASAPPPPTCAVCGKSDWLVAVTDINRRTMHVACWKADQARQREKDDRMRKAR